VNCLVCVVIYRIHSLSVYLGSQLAAQRFVNYWESRLQVFGPKKYVMKMTLSGALRDDLVALMAGVYSLLPKPDASGRPITYLETRRHTMDGYDSDSLVRAVCTFARAVQFL